MEQFKLTYEYLDRNSNRLSGYIIRTIVNNDVSEAMSLVVQEYYNKRKDLEKQGCRMNGIKEEIIRW